MEPSCPVLGFFAILPEDLQKSSEIPRNCDFGGIGAFCAKTFKNPNNCDFGGKSQKIAISARKGDFFRQPNKASKIPENRDFGGNCGKFAISAKNPQKLRFGGKSQKSSKISKILRFGGSGGKASKTAILMENGGKLRFRRNWRFFQKSRQIPKTAISA